MAERCKFGFFAGGFTQVRKIRVRSPARVFFRLRNFKKRSINKCMISEWAEEFVHACEQTAL